MKSVPYASAVESLMYAQVCTRPDLAFVIGMLGRYQKNPGISHWNEIKKALRYIQGTKGLMLTYERLDSLEIVGYSDLDFVGCLDTDRSTSGYVFKLTGGAISWSSSKQTVMTSPTMSRFATSSIDPESTTASNHSGPALRNPSSGGRDQTSRIASLNAFACGQTVTA
jgi:hypothetical protein